MLRRSIAGWLVTLVAIASCRQLLGIDEPMPRDADTRPIDASSDANQAGDASADGTLVQCDSAACAAAGGACGVGGCTFVDPTNVVTCPSGMTCDFRCVGANSCQHDLVCSTNAVCKIECTGQGSCNSSKLNCQPGSMCDLHCDGANSCKYQFQCANTATCRYHCCDVTACNVLSCNNGICTADPSCP